MPDDHSKLVPLLPIPNRTVKRLCADDSAGSRVKVGHRQALTAQKTPVRYDWGFLLWKLRKLESGNTFAQYERAGTYGACGRSP